MNATSLSEYVKSMRKMYGLTQVELSEKYGEGKETLPLDNVL